MAIYNFRKELLIGRYLSLNVVYLFNKYKRQHYLILSRIKPKRLGK